MEDIADGNPSLGMAQTRIGDNGCNSRVVDNIVIVDSHRGDIACCCVDSTF